MANTEIKNAFYAQSGGVTAVINASACGLIETARKHTDKIGKVYAGRNGIIGALTEDLIDTSQESDSDIAALKHTPGGAFGSCRHKLKSIEENEAEYKRLIEVFAAHNIGYFFYNGGGDSQDTAHKISQIGEKMGYPMTCIGVPKTVDNDLPITDCCPGFGSVAKYVATSIREASFDVASMAKTSTKVFVMEVMGRHAGWIAAAGGLATVMANEVLSVSPELSVTVAVRLSVPTSPEAGIQLMLPVRLSNCSAWGAPLNEKIKISPGSESVAVTLNCTVSSALTVRSDTGSMTGGLFGVSASTPILKEVESL